MTTSLTVDIIVLVFIGLSVIIGAIKGGFKSIIGLVVFVASVFLGNFASKKCAPSVVDWLYVKFGPLITDLMDRKLGAMSKLVTPEQVETAVKNAISGPVRVVLWILISLLLWLILGALAAVINSAIKNMPVIKHFNRGLGAVIGLVVPLIVCFALVFGISAIGLSDAVGEKLEDSVSYKVFLALVPKKVKTEGQTITLPVIGDININDLFKLDQFRKDDKDDQKTDDNSNGSSSTENGGPDIQSLFGSISQEKIDQGLSGLGDMNISDAIKEADEKYDLANLSEADINSLKKDYPFLADIDNDTIKAICKLYAQ